jgi:hypothetical protein
MMCVLLPFCSNMSSREPMWWPQWVHGLGMVWAVCTEKPMGFVFIHRPAI